MIEVEFYLIARGIIRGFTKTRKTTLINSIESVLQIKNAHRFRCGVRFMKRRGVSYLKASSVVMGALAKLMTDLRACLLLCIFRAAAVSSSSVVSPSSG